MHRLVKAVAVLVWLPALAGAQNNSDTYALEGARIIDGTGRQPIENGVLVIVDGSIHAVGRVSEVAIPRGARRVCRWRAGICPPG